MYLFFDYGVGPIRLKYRGGWPPPGSWFPVSGLEMAGQWTSLLSCLKDYFLFSNWSQWQILCHRTPFWSGKPKPHSCSWSELGLRRPLAFSSVMDCSVSDSTPTQEPFILRGSCSCYWLPFSCSSQCKSAAWPPNGKGLSGPHRQTGPFPVSLA